MNEWASVQQLLLALCKEIKEMNVHLCDLKHILETSTKVKK